MAFVGEKRYVLHSTWLQGSGIDIHMKGKELKVERLPRITKNVTRMLLPTPNTTGGKWIKKQNAPVSYCVRLVKISA